MNSGITRGGLSRNSRRRSQIQVPEPSGKGGGGWKIPGFVYFFPAPPQRFGFEIPQKTEKQKSWNCCGFKKEDFWDVGFLGRVGMLVFSIAIALQKKPQK